MLKVGDVTWVSFSRQIHIFDHKNIIKYCNRPFDTVEQMNQAIIDNINAVATENDVLFHLGDFCFTKRPKDAEAIVASIRPKVVLIFGNHDRRKMLSKAGLAAVGDECYLEYEGEIIWMNHYPAIRSQYDIENNRQCPRQKAARPYTILLHGHRHAENKLEAYRMFMGKPHIDVGVDANNFKPYSIDEIVKLGKDLVEIDGFMGMD